MAHILAQSPGGPRASASLSLEQIDSYENLILVCDVHHREIDGQPQSWSLEKLKQVKEDHEHWVREQLSREERFRDVGKPIHLRSDTILSTLLPVSAIPTFAYFAPTESSEGDIRTQIVGPAADEIMLPYIVRGKQLIAFDDLTSEKSPFRKVIDPYAAKRKHINECLSNQDWHRWYVTLLNRVLNKITGRLNLQLDKEHHRYYFEPAERGQRRTVRYKTVGGKNSTRQVAWQPILKATGEPRKYWEHLAASLQFLLMGEDTWALSIRPERRFTKDGYEPLTPKGIGRRSTSRKSHMYNVDVLEEVQFWKDYLCRGKPRLLANFGKEKMTIENKLISGLISWPEIVGDIKGVFKVQYEEDLFSLADYREAVELVEDDYDGKAGPTLRESEEGSRDEM